MIFDGVRVVMGHTFGALEAAPKEVFELTPRCFELYGADVMLTEDWEVVLLEVNGTPGAYMAQGKHEMSFVDVLDDAMRLSLDTWFPLPDAQAAQVDARRNGFIPCKQ